MVRDNITRTGARAPGVKRRMSLEWRCSTEQVTPTQCGEVHAAAESTKDGGKPDLVTGTLGASLTKARPGKALSDRPALEPYWGKPTVRNLWGGRWKRRHHPKPDPRHRPTRPQETSSPN